MDLKDLIDLEELKQIDPNRPGEWPLLVKIITILLLFIALGGAVYYFDTQHQLIRLAKVAKLEQELRQTFETKQSKAANLEEYRKQLADMQESFGAMVRQLPNKTEVAALLVDVSQTGLANGLEFLLFQPDAEKNQSFYAELPIRISVNGTYHDFGRFISGLAALQRIVTIHNIQIIDNNKGTAGSAAKKGSSSVAKNTEGKLNLQATVKTYHYLEEKDK